MQKVSKDSVARARRFVVSKSIISDFETPAHSHTHTYAIMARIQDTSADV